MESPLGGLRLGGCEELELVDGGTTLAVDDIEADDLGRNGCELQFEVLADRLAAMECLPVVAVLVLQFEGLDADTEVHALVNQRPVEQFWFTEIDFQPTGASAGVGRPTSIRVVINGFRCFEATVGLIDVRSLGRPALGQ